ncbi:AzlC family ABC transporter permease [Lactonifactor longoviformis]|uniref:AzlC family ABC transporter permease n=1 Tax=Lactonifactor longoviformis TaxID=341220 RepID=UPI00210EA480|nr:AzlC family ABC transporter permease [Lactonifactor longoviformis]MCQ4672284.1 AzlC family ABC transporter permease [Lactonifactor longoviformis]
MKKKAFRAAFPYTIPICAGFMFLGIAYGIFMRSKGFAFWYPMLMSATIFAGSMEFVAVSLLLSPFQPFYALLLALMVNARHLFYGLSMLEKYRGTGRKKWYLIFGMCDESFSINCTTDPPAGIDRGWFMFFVTLLNQCYWFAGATAGAVLGGFLHFDTKGLDFVMTALFVVIFLDQWFASRDHFPAVIGVVATAVCLFLFGPDNFILPSMATMLAILTILRGGLEKKEGDVCP